MRRRSSRIDPRQLRVFICPVCRSEMVCPKFTRLTPLGHEKSLWCYRCKEVRQFIQIA